jgi:Methylamine utilisation protein MauE
MGALFAEASPGAAVAIRVTLALVFLNAAAGKMRHWLVFQGVVANYRLLPGVLVRPFAHMLPPLEALVGVLLLCNALSPWPEIAAAALLIVFATAMAVNLFRGRRQIDCGCFQNSLQTLRWRLVARNLAMVLLLAAAAVAGHGVSNAWTVLNGVLAGAALFIVVECLNALWAILPAFRPAHLETISRGEA